MIKKLWKVEIFAVANTTLNEYVVTFTPGIIFFLITHLTVPEREKFQLLNCTPCIITSGSIFGPVRHS